VKRNLRNQPRRFGGRNGNAMVEFAVGFTVLMTAFTSTFQYGYIFYQYNNLFNAVNNAAHYAAMYPYDSSCETPSTAYSTAVKNMVVYGNPAGTGNPVLSNLSTSNVNVIMARVSGSGNSCNDITSTFKPGSITVSISNYTFNGLFGTFTANNKPSVTYAYQGMYSPPTS
jgi:Flp pilus assembly protein TadG